MTTICKQYSLTVPSTVDSAGTAQDISDLEAVRSAVMIGGGSSGTLKIQVGDGTNFADVDGWIWNASSRGQLREAKNGFTHARVYRSAAGSGETVLVSGQIDASSQLPQKHAATFTHADLTAASTSQALSFGSALPANARILSWNVKLSTAFTGGGATACSVDVGSTGDADALIDGANLFAAAVDGLASSAPAGVAPHKHFASATQLSATFVSDVNVADLTAGSATIELLYIVQS